MAGLVYQSLSHLTLGKSLTEKLLDLTRKLGKVAGYKNKHLKINSFPVY